MDESAATAQSRFARFNEAQGENRYLQLKPLREQERKRAVKAGLIPDPSLPRRLDEALAFTGTCLDMCPEFEREEREYQKNVDTRWETIPGTARIDPIRAVKAFHRPAAGNEQPLPSDVRPPHVLKTTLDYLIKDILAQDPTLVNSHHFLRDRTRSIRQDFTVQHERGQVAVESHERIARYHIVCLHMMRETESFNESQELEQLRKVLQSLNEFYDDARHSGIVYPNEPEFRAYYIATHLRDADVIRQVELLPSDIFASLEVQTALKLQCLAQRNTETKGERGRRPANSEASVNGFSRFFKTLSSTQTSFLLACLLESHFPDIRRGGLLAMKRAYLPQHPGIPAAELAKMLGFDGETDCITFCEDYGLSINQATNEVALHKNSTIEEPAKPKRSRSRRVVYSKLGTASISDVINGLVSMVSPVTQKIPKTLPLQISTKKVELPKRKLSSAVLPSPKPTTLATPRLNPAASAFVPKASIPSPKLASTTTTSSAFGFPTVPTLVKAQERVPMTISVAKTASPIAAKSPAMPSPAKLVTPMSARPRKTSLATSMLKTQPKVVPKLLAHIDAFSASMVEMMLDGICSTIGYNAAVDAISIIRNEEVVAMNTERGQLLDAAAKALSEDLLAEVQYVAILEAVAAIHERQHRLPDFISSWRKARENREDLRRKNASKQKMFSELSQSLNGHSIQEARSFDGDADLAASLVLPDFISWAYTRSGSQSASAMLPTDSTFLQQKFDRMVGPLDVDDNSEPNPRCATSIRADSIAVPLSQIWSNAVFDSFAIVAEESVMNDLLRVYIDLLNDLVIVASAACGEQPACEFPKYIAPINDLTEYTAAIEDMLDNQTINIFDLNLSQSRGRRSVTFSSRSSLPTLAAQDLLQLLQQLALECLTDISTTLPVAVDLVRLQEWFQQRVYSATAAIKKARAVKRRRSDDGMNVKGRKKMASEWMPDRLAKLRDAVKAASQELS